MLEDLEGDGGEGPAAPGGPCLETWKIAKTGPDLTGASGKPLEGPQRPSKKNDLEEAAVRLKVWGTSF